MTCYECGRPTRRYYQPSLCYACLDEARIGADAIERGAVECCQCHGWTVQPVWQSPPWDTAQTRPWCQACVESEARDVAAAFARLAQGQP